MPCPRWLLAFALLMTGAADARAEDSVTAHLAVSAQFSGRSALRVSSDVLRFVVAPGDGGATATVRFSAAARTVARGDVMLSVQSLGPLTGPAGLADGLSAVTLEGDPEAPRGDLRLGNGPTLARRWSGSGLRTGELRFTLRAPAAGEYVLPVLFVLALP